VQAYERVWRDGVAADLAGLFTADAEYLVEPYATPRVGLPAIEALWAGEIDADEVFTMSHVVVACGGATGVVRVEVRYGEPVAAEYRDLWVVTFTADGRASRFEEWPFWPSHGRAPARHTSRSTGRGRRCGRARWRTSRAACRTASSTSPRTSRWRWSSHLRSPASSRR
jgi:hypothetical protein